jgi:hypothetical protein
MMNVDTPPLQCCRNPFLNQVNFYNLVPGPGQAEVGFEFFRAVQPSYNEGPDYPHSDQTVP